MRKDEEEGMEFSEAGSEEKKEEQVGESKNEQDNKGNLDTSPESETRGGIEQEDKGKEEEAESERKLDLTELQNKESLDFQSFEVPVANQDAQNTIQQPSLLEQAADKSERQEASSDSNPQAESHVEGSAIPAQEGSATDNQAMEVPPQKVEPETKAEPTSTQDYSNECWKREEEGKEAQGGPQSKQQLLFVVLGILFQRQFFLWVKPLFLLFFFLVILIFQQQQPKSQP